MKKYLLFLWLPVVVIVNAESSTPKAKPSAYQAIIQKYELGLKNQDLIEELDEIAHRSFELKKALRSEIDICSQVERCENSQRLEELFKEFSTVSLEYHRKENELLNSDASKQIREIFKQYAQ